MGTNDRQKRTSAYLPTFTEPTPRICLANSTFMLHSTDLPQKPYQHLGIHPFMTKICHENSALTYSDVSVLNRLDAVGDFAGFLDVINDSPLVGICGYTFLNPLWIEFLYVDFYCERRLRDRYPVQHISSFLQTERLHKALDILSEALCDCSLGLAFSFGVPEFPHKEFHTVHRVQLLVP